MLCACVLAANTLGYYHANPAAQEVKIGWIAINAGYFTGITLVLIYVIRRWFVNMALVFLGSVSYLLYLIHPIVLRLISRLLKKSVA